MKRFNQHIAIILFGIFFFPIVFQSIHIVKHHSNVSNFEQHFCGHIEIEDLYTASHEFYSFEDRSCLICDYQFSINDLPKVLYFGKEIPALKYTYIEIAVLKPFNQFSYDKTPRGPPILNS